MVLLPEFMHGVLLKGHGDVDQLEYRTDIPVPVPSRGQVLIQVGAAGINNTDINTRTGWYSRTDTAETSSDCGEKTGWSGIPLKFPLIQGADCCGKIVAVGEGVSPDRIGERVLVRTMLRSPVKFRPFECWTFGSECNGGFAQFTLAPDDDVWSVKSHWSDEELASIPCSYSTAEGMLHRARVTHEDRVLITGASGGVGSAAIQLAKCRGAEVLAITSKDKAEWIKALGADQVFTREDDLIAALGENSISAVVDLVGGKQWEVLLRLLQTGGRYAISGAIGGPLVNLDLRTIYLKDLSILGCTWQEDDVFQNLIRLIEEDKIRPMVSQTYNLSDIKLAQKDFIDKKYPGKLVLVPPQ